jgi:hypothetical protein
MYHRAFLGGVLGSAALLADFRAGAALERITPALDPAKPVYLAGFANGRRATGVMDHLHSRCLAMSAGAKPVVICSVDSIGLFFDDVQRIRQEVERRWAKPVAVIVAATHSHQTPDTMGLWGPKEGVSGIDEDYNAFVVQRTAGAAVAALRGMRSARLHLSRTYPLELDTYIDDDRPPKQHDAELVLLRVSRGNGRTIATLINWANHPEALGSKNTLLTPDFPAALARDTESRLGGITIFVNGALGGMQSPLGAKVRDPRYGELAPPETKRFMDAMGGQIAEVVLDATENVRPSPVKSITYREIVVRIPVANEGFRMASQAKLYGGRKAFNADGTTSTPVGLLRISGSKGPLLEAVTIPGELFPELSVGGTVRYPEADFPDAPIEMPIKKMMTAPYRMLFGIANDEIGYILPKAEWDEKPPYLNGAKKRWYGEVNSVGPEAAPIVADAVASLLREK